MKRIVSISDCSELDAYKGDWTRLSEAEPYFVPDLGLLQRDLRVSGNKFRLLAVRENSQTKALACFIYYDTIKRFEFATRKLFELSAREVSLYGSCVLGQPDEETIRELFRLAFEGLNFDLINAGEILVDSPLYRVLTSFSGLAAWRLTRKQELRWLVRLPDTFDSYMSSLRPTAKTRVLRDVRKFEREQPEYRLMCRAEDVDVFLREAELVSRRTYQWQLGYGVNNDAQFREHLLWLARNGLFRGYIVSLDGKSCAFGWGEMNRRTFIFRATGYDPQYRVLSPGTALIMHMIRDLIDNTTCEMFDFGAGSEDGYKSRLGTISLPCARMAAAPIYRPYPMLLAGLDLSVNLTKNSIMKMMETVAASSILRRRLKSVLRPLGVSSY